MKKPAKALSVVLRILGINITSPLSPPPGFSCVSTTLLGYCRGKCGVILYSTMKLALLATVAPLVLPFMVGCGGGTLPLTLTVLPPATTLNVDTPGTGYSNFPYVQLQPSLSNGVTPSGVQ